MKCKFCEKEYKDKLSLGSHEWRCPKNENRKYKNGMLGKKGSNQFTKAKRLGLVIPGLSEEHKKKLSLMFKDKPWSAEQKKKHSIVMQKVVEDNIESYISGNRGRVKNIKYDGLNFHGKWELSFYKWCKENKISIEKVHKGFDYIWNGVRKYYPDFYLPEKDAYVEVKGYKTERDEAKWKSFPHKLIIINSNSMNKIFNGTFELTVE